MTPKERRAKTAERVRRWRARNPGQGKRNCVRVQETQSSKDSCELEVYYQQNKAKLYERKKAYLARNPAKLRRWKNADYQRHRESYIARAHVGQQRIAFHFTNLQPLWAIDNIRKGARTMTVNMLGKVERDAQQSTAGSRARFDLCYVRYFLSEP